MSKHGIRTKNLVLPAQDVLDKRFHVIMGKGGVGKSTVAMTLGLYYAQHGLRTLICEVDDREMLSYAFSAPSSGSNIQFLQDNLAVVSIDSQNALSEYGVLKLKIKALSTLLTENPFTQALISIVPGVADLLALGKAFNHEREKSPINPSQPAWDRVILDAPSTGHGLTFLRLPQVIKEVVPSGNMRQEADEMWTLLSEPTRSAIHIVSTGEELPIQEARELWHTLVEKLGIRAQALWLNKVDLSPFTPSEWSEFQAQINVSTPKNELMKNMITAIIQRHDQGLIFEKNLDLFEHLTISKACIPNFLVHDHALLKEALAYTLEAQK